MSVKEALIVVRNEKDLAVRGADIFYRTARDAVELQGRFALALSGGATPRPMHRLLCQEPYLSDIPWDNTHLFWVDERMLPFDHPDSNFGTAKRDFLDRIPISPGQVHPMPVWVRPEKAASLYQAEIRSYFEGFGTGDPVFDLVYLGVGRDGHTASLFPGQTALEESKAWVLLVKGGDPDLHRLTLTLPVLNRSKHTVFIVSGDGKAPVLKSLFEKKTDPLPAGKIQPIRGRLTWLLDQAAASLLPKEIRDAKI